MIIAIADDLTGAAEIAGIGLRYNLDIQLCLSLPAMDDFSHNLVVVCTNSRSLKRDEAIKITGQVAKKIAAIHSRRMYKKIDSVFRGYVLDEIRTEMKLLGLDRALIVAANPSLGRTIKNGEYFINEIPIHQTDFATDPEFSMNSPLVLEMVKASPGEVKILKHTEELPAEGIVIGETASAIDIEAWAKKIDNTWLLAGGGDFFTALLKVGYNEKPKATIEIPLPHLYVSGTAFGKSRAFIKQIEHRLHCVAFLPETMMETGIGDEKWFDYLTAMLHKHKKAVIAFDEEERKKVNVSPRSLRTTMSKAVRRIVEKENIRELFIEGGSTAAAILQELNINKLTPVNELQRGVVRMKAGSIFITVKPGSYELPTQLKELY